MLGRRLGRGSLFDGLGHCRGLGSVLGRDRHACGSGGCSSGLDRALMLTEGGVGSERVTSRKAERLCE